MWSGYEGWQYSTQILSPTPVNHNHKQSMQSGKICGIVQRSVYALSRLFNQSMPQYIIQ
jgi:hypothetical protein